MSDFIKLPLTMFTEWLATGDRGSSSNAIVSHLTGSEVGRDYGFPDHPYDPGDLNRCVKLIEQYPVIRLTFNYMASRSPEWAALVGAWEELTALLLSEIAQNTGKAPATYARMQEVIKGARKAT